MTLTGLNIIISAALAGYFIGSSGPPSLSFPSHPTRYPGSPAVATLGPGRLKIGLVGIMKNEGHIIAEWLEHYSWQGIDVIVLLDNGSDMPFNATLPVGSKSILEVIKAPRRHAQAAQYNELAVPRMRAHGVDVVMVSDLDEFVFGKDPSRPVAVVLSEVFAQPHVSHTCVYWTSFGWSHHKEQPPSVRLGFSWRADAVDNIFMKCAVRLSELTWLGIHAHTWRNGSEVVAPDELQLNHYYLQSEAFYFAVKTTRGAVNTPHQETFRGELFACIHVLGPSPCGSLTIAPSAAGIREVCGSSRDCNLSRLCMPR